MSPPQGPPQAAPIEGVRVFALCYPDADGGTTVEPEDVAWLGTEIEDLEAVAYHRDSDGRIVVRTFPSAASSLTSPGMAEDLRLIWVTPDPAPGTTKGDRPRDTQDADWHSPS